MSSYDNRYNDIDDEPDFDYVNDDYGFDMDDDKEPSARTSTGASKNHKKKKASKPVTIWSEILSYIKILAAAVIIAFVFTQYIIVNAEVPSSYTPVIRIDAAKPTVLPPHGYRQPRLIDTPKVSALQSFRSKASVRTWIRYRIWSCRP